MSVRDILALLPNGGPVEVVGTGAFADELRRQLGHRAHLLREGKPSAIIDTSGEDRAIVAALQRVDDLGTVVLAGLMPTNAMSLDLYADVHVRGLTIIGAS